jgi:hypothetical protein
MQYDPAVRRKGTARFVLGLVVAGALGDILFARSIEIGLHVAGGAGVVAALVVLGFGLALVFTAVYDGFPARRKRFASASPPPSTRAAAR